MTKRLSGRWERECRQYGDEFLHFEFGSNHAQAHFRKGHTPIPYGNRCSDSSYRNIRSRIKAAALGRNQRPYLNAKSA
jgi:hypothetical protein